MLFPACRVRLSKVKRKSEGVCLMLYWHIISTDTDDIDVSFFSFMRKVIFLSPFTCKYRSTIGHMAKAHEMINLQYWNVNFSNFIMLKYV